MTNAEKISYAVLSNGTLTREQISEWIKKDLSGVYICIAEILNSPEIHEAFVEVMWQRYIRLQKGKEVTDALQPELPLE